MSECNRPYANVAALVFALVMLTLIAVSVIVVTVYNEFQSQQEYSALLTRLNTKAYAENRERAALQTKLEIELRAANRKIETLDTLYTSERENAIYANRWGRQMERELEGSKKYNEELVRDKDFYRKEWIETCNALVYFRERELFSPDLRSLVGMQTAYPKKSDEKANSGRVTAVQLKTKTWIPSY